MSLYTEASVSSDFKVFLPHLFLKMISLLSPISHFHQPCEHSAFTVRVSKEESFSKLVCYITLLQSYKFVSHKKTHFVLPSSLGEEVRPNSNFEAKSLPSNFNLEKMKCFHKQTWMDSTEVYSKSTWWYCFPGRGTRTERSRSCCENNHII